MVLTACFALSPVTGLVCPHRQRSYLRQLDASVGASGPHGFAVRELSAFVNAPPHVHRIPSRIRDDREPPLLGRDGRICRNDLPDGESGIFFETGLDNQLICATRADLPVGQFASNGP